MFKSAFFGRKTDVKPFKDYHNEWFTTLKTTLLPQLRRVLSAVSISPILLSTQVDALHHHFNAYYEALDLAAADDVAQCLFPEWRNPLERPFMWVGDLHPYLFTNLLRSYLDDQETEDDETEREKYDDGWDEEEESQAEKTNSFAFLDKSWHVANAWKGPSRKFTLKIDQIECGLRLMVPALSARMRNAQYNFLGKIGSDWGEFDGRKAEMKGAISAAVAEEMEEMVGVVVDANRLRRSVLAEILSVTDVYQGALFLEGLAQFLVGFKDHKLLNEFDKCKTAINF